ncbi:Zinc finger protein 64-like protein [Armadillidium nasatum]|uniref:Zinc finger protein 64-like protein n=1 Tax=Armadillidium nasatum TaxID=96803 RepID=A0A5N5SJS0_9CRUS|nr:Zinc finger protein 64-like protein [Armadillidium nasatum]
MAPVNTSLTAIAGHRIQLHNFRLSSTAFKFDLKPILKIKWLIYLDNIIQILVFTTLLGLLKDNTGGDVLICGTCCTQFSDLKLFIDHKQSCGNASLISNNSDVCNYISPSTGQQTSHFGSQQIVIPMQGHASIVSLPVGMPHVILQASSGLSQMYRIVLEPIKCQIYFNLLIHIMLLLQIKLSQQRKSKIFRPYLKKITLGEENLTVETDTLPLSNSSITRLTPVNPVDTTWSANKMEPSSVTFNSVVPEHEDEKSYKNLPSPSLHTEEEVATFLATQLVSQTNAPSQNSKSKASSSMSKHNLSIGETSFTHQSAEYIDVNEKIETPLPEKVDAINLKNEECSVKVGIRNEVQDGDQDQPALQFFEKKSTTARGRKQLVCSYRNCSFTTIHKTDMIRHSRKHTGTTKLCQFCSYGAKDGSHLSVHLRFHTGDAPFHCQVDGCSATFKTSSDLKRHGKLHTGERPFKCFECDYASSLKVNHQYIDSKDHNTKFPRKMEQTEGLLPFKNHRLPKVRRTSKPIFPKNFVCIECGSDFVREDSYRSHIRQHEQKQKENEKVSRGKADEASVKGKMKSVYTLNYAIQNTTEGLQGGTGHESFPYMITIDGIPSVFPSPPPNPKDEDGQPLQNSIPEDSVVHNGFLTPTVNPSSRKS